VKDGGKGDTGIIAFFGIPGYAVEGGGFGGHIDLITEDSYMLFGKSYTCIMGCHWEAKKKFWFWPIA
jgi:hypothetical protein